MEFDKLVFYLDDFEEWARFFAEFMEERESDVKMHTTIKNEDGQFMLTFHVFKGARERREERIRNWVEVMRKQHCEVEELGQ